LSGLKLNYLVIVGAILAFISIVLPWWTMTLSLPSDGVSASIDASMYLYQVTVLGRSTGPGWYSWVALAFVVIGGIFGIVGSIVKHGKRLVAGGGVLALLSIIVYAAGLQLDLMQGTSEVAVFGIPGLGLFSSGTLTYGSVSLNYTSYLSFGFWLALVSAIVLFIAVRMHPREELVPPPPPPMPQQLPPEVPPPPGP